MFGKKKEIKKQRPPRPTGSLAQYGILEIPENLSDLGGKIDLDDDDEDLEAELAALTADDQPKRPAPRRPPPKATIDIDKMISESIKDINSDEEMSGDDDDPDLLNELKIITGEAEENTAENPVDELTAVGDTEDENIKILEERLSMYKTAEIRARAENESNKVKRYNRGIKTLEKLLSTCRSGKEIDSSEIPPLLPPSSLGNLPAKQEVAEPNEVSSESNITLQDTPFTNELEPKNPDLPTSQADNEILNALKNRQKEYKIAALEWKKAGNQQEAVNHIRIAKQFDSVISNLSESASEDNTVDLSDMPPKPSLPSCTTADENFALENKEENVHQKAAQPNIPVNIPETPSIIESLETALKERLEIYSRSKTVAETERNSSKARRYGRICKQFEDAIKLHAKGKPVSLDELPTPPGFPPLSTPKAPSTSPSKPTINPPEISKPSEPLAHSESPKTSPKKVTTPVPPPRTNSDKKKKLTTRVDKQIEVLQQRQRELKMSALKAKKEGDLDLARDYLRQAKGIDPLINASLAGLPVDMNSIPLSHEAKLQLNEQLTDPAKITDDGFTLISSLDCLEEATGTDQQIYENLEAQLKKQIKRCLTTRDHCKALGDVASYNKWGRLAFDYTKDLDMLRVRKRDNHPPPQHHYEMKTYAIVQSCTDLTDADIEISIIRGVNYPKEVDSYVIFEFPWPTDTPSTDRTLTIRDNCNPEYNATFPLNGIIDRKSRQCLRIFKRHSIKCQVWSKGGFFRADSLVGTVNVKLQPLETKCVLHDSFPLMDGRKAVGGKLEVKIRLRNPIATKQIEHNTDKWLTIEH